MVYNIVVIYCVYAINQETYIIGMIRGSSYILTPFLARPKICIINVVRALVIVLVVVVAILAVTGVTNLLALSSSCPSAHLLGWYSSEPEFRPAGHQANQLGRPARGLQSAPGKSNTGLPFPPGSECVCVCVCVCVCAPPAGALISASVCGSVHVDRAVHTREMYLLNVSLLWKSPQREIPVKLTFWVYKTYQYSFLID